MAGLGKQDLHVKIEMTEAEDNKQLRILTLGFVLANTAPTRRS